MNVPGTVEEINLVEQYGNEITITTSFRAAFFASKSIDGNEISKIQPNYCEISNKVMEVRACLDQ
jgi:hypothetical protein